MEGNILFQLTITHAVQQSFRKRFLEWNSDSDVDVGKLKSQRISCSRFLLWYITHFLLLMAIHVKNSLFVYRLSNECQVAICWSRWSNLSWCGYQRFNFLEKPHTSSRLWTVSDENWTLLHSILPDHNGLLKNLSFNKRMTSTPWQPAPKLDRFFRWNFKTIYGMFGHYCILSINVSYIAACYCCSILFTKLAYET